MTDYLEMAKQALERPSDFGWWGKDEMFVTWGITGPHFATNSDDVLSESNFLVFGDMAKKEFGTDTDEFGPCLDVVSMKHWAHGSIQSYICKVVDDSRECDYIYNAAIHGKHVDRDTLNEEDLTEEFIWLCDILIGIRDDYPILDEEHFSTLEYDRHYDWFVNNEIPFEVKNEGVDNLISKLHEWEFDFNPDYGEYPTLDDILQAAYVVEADCREFSDEEWKAWEFLNPSFLIQRTV